jgi:signal transduction histidine kinase
MKSGSAEVSIPSDIFQKWQRIVDLLASIMRVPSAVVCKLEPPHYTHYKVVSSSNSEGNPFPADDVFAMDIGTFCETVIKSRAPLLVANALEDDQWTQAPEIKTGMVSYLGLPVVWPDGRMFGTICVLDDKTNRYSDLYQELLAHCRDVLEADLQMLVRMSDELQNLQLELADANRIATLGQLSASIAHELNQPLTGIMANCSTCLRMMTSEPQDLAGAQEAVRRTMRDGDRASQVVARLRALFTNKAPAFEPVDLNEAAREVLALSIGEIQNSRSTLRSELAPDLPPAAADRVQLQQVVLNLLRNALDAMVTVEDRPREVLIKTEREEGGSVRFSVMDAGIGFDPRRTDKLFEPFFTTKHAGMGVGLAVSRSIIENHQGRLWAVLNDGPGATFSFSVPCFHA